MFILNHVHFVSIYFGIALEGDLSVMFFGGNICYIFLFVRRFDVDLQVITDLRRVSGNWRKGGWR